MRKKLIDFFASLRLTLFLIFLTAFLASLGTFLPQGADAVGIAKKWGPETYHVLQTLGITDTYHSWWFMLDLLLMGLNLWACTIKRLPKVWRLHERTEEAVLKDSDIPKSSFTEKWETPLSPGESLQKARTFLGASFRNLREISGTQSTAVWGEKNFLSLWGAYIVHLGLMLLLLGGGMRVLFGYTKYMMIHEGGDAQVPMERIRFHPHFSHIYLPGSDTRLPFFSLFERGQDWQDYTLHLNSFDLDYYKGSSVPKMYRSNIRVVGPDGNTLATAAVEVNHPFTYRGVRFYQASYGYDGARAVHMNIELPGDKSVYEVWAPYQKLFPLLKTGWSLKVTNFFPDATMGAPGQIVQEGAELKNPAIKLEFYHHGVLKSNYWTFFAFPEINESKVKGLAVQGLSVDPIAYTVLQVDRDPSVPFALAGALIILAGLVLSFYFFYKKLWIIVGPAGEGGSRVEIVGVCKRNKLSFKSQFQALAGEFRGLVGSRDLNPPKTEEI